APLVIHFSNGNTVRLSDVATVTDGVQDQRNAGQTSLADGSVRPAILLVIRRSADANIIATIDRIRAELPALRESMPASIDMQVAQDRSPTI
ncbi:efflux RND transporter permease subunit, partial [Salmonella enterica subsp. enterica]